jgi:hypothetical protein
VVKSSGLLCRRAHKAHKVLREPGRRVRKDRAERRAQSVPGLRVRLEARRESPDHKAQPEFRDQREPVHKVQLVEPEHREYKVRATEHKEHRVRMVLVVERSPSYL